MSRAFFSQMLACVVSVLLIVVGILLPAQAMQMTGQYSEDGIQVITVLRSALSPLETPEASELAKTEADAAMQAFSARYHGPRFDKKLSYTTLRTIFNTVASNYRSKVQRPLKEEKVQRILDQLKQAEVALKRGN
jgi:photosystem II Psb27 protein